MRGSCSHSLSPLTAVYLEILSPEKRWKVRVMVESWQRQVWQRQVWQRQVCAPHAVSGLTFGHSIGFRISGLGTA